MKTENTPSINLPFLTKGTHTIPQYRENREKHASNKTLGTAFNQKATSIVFLSLLYLEKNIFLLEAVSLQGVRGDNVENLR